MSQATVEVVSGLLCRGGATELGFEGRPGVCYAEKEE